MKKSAATTGVAIAAISLAVGLSGCGSDSKSNETTTTTTTTSTSTSTTTTSAQASGQNQTLADYLKKNNIKEIPISRGTPGAPVVDLPVPEGWSVLPDSEDAPYGGIVFDAPSDPNDPPKFVAVFERLEGNVNTDELLAAAPGEVMNLEGFEGGEGQEGELSGFPASQIGGSYIKNGAKRTAAQKSVVIQAPDGIYLLVLSGTAPDAEFNVLMDATSVIDEKTVITV